MNSNLFSGGRNFSTHVLVLAAVVSTFLLITPMAAIGAGTGEYGNVCLNTLKPHTNCTANDVTILSVTQHGSLTTTCAAGNGIAEGDFDVTVGTTTSNERYDIGIFMSQNGDSAQTGSNCLHDALVPAAATIGGATNLNSGVGPFANLDGDFCGDITHGTQAIKTVHLKFACVDLNNDGKVDIPACSSWINNAEPGDCLSVHDAIPGTPAKCDCHIVATDVLMPTGTPAITVTKDPASQQVESGGTANFQITVTNSGTVALSNIQVTDPLCTLSGPPLSGVTLQPNDHLDFTCATSDVTSPFTNTVTAQGTVVGGPTVTDTADADVTIAMPVVAMPVPTLTEWGIILFVMISVTGSVYYLRRRKKA